MTFKRWLEEHPEVQDFSREQQMEMYLQYMETIDSLITDDWTIG